MISLVMAVRDALPWARRAIDSVARHTTEPFELIIVDNGSGPETSAYLRQTNARVLRNEDNQGCAAAWNQGIAVARGEHVCLLNSDVEVAGGWLGRLAAFHEPTRSPGYRPRSGRGRSTTISTPSTAGSGPVRASVLLRRVPRHGPLLARDLYARVGGFDEAYARAKYEDEDMFWRIRQAGLRAAVTLGVVVHHHGSRTVREERPRAPGFEAANKRYFDRKWRDERLRRKGWKLRLAVRHLLWRLRGGPSY